jgi:hypothetical protein
MTKTIIQSFLVLNLLNLVTDSIQNSSKKFNYKIQRKSFIFLIHNLAYKESAYRLYFDLFGNQSEILSLKNYRRLIRPIGNNISEKLTVKIGLKLIQILDLDQKNQVLKTNVFLSQEWYDKNLVWDPLNYNGISFIYVPSSYIW